jgi:N-acetylmuramoyl-L-alanine amidase
MTHLGDSWSQTGRVRVVVDPGHGGGDSGVSLPDGIQEKEVTLMIANEIQKVARSMGWLQVRLTRETDEDLSWGSRKQAARGADLWISLHLNADAEGKARGPRVFYSQRGVLEEPEGVSSGSKSDVRTILRDMALTKKHNESALLAEHIQRALEATWGVALRPTSAAPLLGMGELECPAVLVEVGFLSHRTDRGWLLKPEGREQLARAILRGIQSFMHDPHKKE